MYGDCAAAHELSLSAGAHYSGASVYAAWRTCIGVLSSAPEPSHSDCLNWKRRRTLLDIGSAPEWRVSARGIDE